MRRIDQATLGRRLREARENCGISQEQAAEALSLPRTAIVNMEAGTRSVSSTELLALASLYKREISEFFAEEMQPTDDPLVVFYRLDPALQQDPAIVQEVERWVAVCREGAELKAVLGFSEVTGPPVYARSAPSSPGEAVSQGAQVAKEERKRLGLGDAPIADLAELLNAQGIWATGVDFPDRLSGLFLNHRSTGMAVIVNRGHGPLRKRFSYAHEYAHALLDRDRGGVITSSDTASQLIEKRANAFAAAFLMPAEGVHRFLDGIQKGQPSRVEQSIFDAATGGRIDTQLRTVPGSQKIGYQDVVRVADWFKVSYQAAAYRMRSLDIFSQPECQSLIKQDDLASDMRRALQIPDPCENDRELFTQVIRLVIEARRREEITRGRVMELGKILGVGGRKLLEWAEAGAA